MGMPFENRVHDIINKYSFGVRYMTPFEISKNVTIHITTTSEDAREIDERLSHLQFQLTCLIHKPITLITEHMINGKSGRMISYLNEKEKYDWREPVGKPSRRSARRF